MTTSNTLPFHHVDGRSQTIRCSRQYALFAGVATLLAYGSAAQALRVVTTGDSLTTGYSPVRLQQAFDAVRPGVTVSSVASGGCDAPRFAGRTPEPWVGGVRLISGGSGYTSPPIVTFTPADGRYGTGAAAAATVDAGAVVSVVLTSGGSGYVVAPIVELVGGGGTGAVAEATMAYDIYADQVLLADPDVIVFMLGTNDAGRDCRIPEDWEFYQATVLAAFDTWAASVNSRNRHPRVIVMTPPPVIRVGLEYYDACLDGQIIPWLKEQAQVRRLTLLDINTLIQQEPDWQAFYSDGIHLYANNGAGFRWLAGKVANRVRATAGDFEADGDVDLSDFGKLQSCFNGPNRPPAQTSCEDADLDADADVDLADFGYLQSCYNGPNRPPACNW